MVYVAGALGGAGWAKVMALAIALSVTAATGTGIVLTSRIVYGMASYRTLPPILGNVSTRWRTPAVASIVVGFLIIAVIWVYILGTSTQSLLSDVVSLAGLMAAAFYVLTALATVAYYRRRILANWFDAIVVGLLPIAAAAFLVWIMIKSIQGESAGQKWALVGIVVAGIVVMAAVRVILRPDFFHLPREAASRKPGQAGTARAVLASSETSAGGAAGARRSVP